MSAFLWRVPGGIAHGLAGRPCSPGSPRPLARAITTEDQWRDAGQRSVRQIAPHGTMSIPSERRWRPDLTRLPRSITILLWLSMNRGQRAGRRVHSFHEANTRLYWDSFRPSPFDATHIRTGGNCTAAGAPRACNSRVRYNKLAEALAFSIHCIQRVAFGESPITQRIITFMTRESLSSAVASAEIT
jgi:hypothetical protein